MTKKKKAPKLAQTQHSLKKECEKPILFYLPKRHPKAQSDKHSDFTKVTVMAVATDLHRISLSPNEKTSDNAKAMNCSIKLNPESGYKVILA